MPSPTVISLLQIIGVSAAALTIAAAVTPRLSRFGRPALLVAWASLLVLAGLRDATHVKVLHNDVLMLLAFLPLAVGAADVRLGDRSESVRWGWPRRLAVAVVGLAYFFTAYQKLRITGLDWVTSDNLRWVMVEGLVSDRAPTRVVASWLVDRPLVCHGLAAITILTELSAPVVLATRRTRPWFFLVAVALHGGIWLTLGLDYWGWILTVGALVLPWHRVRSVSVLAV